MFDENFENVLLKINSFFGAVTTGNIHQIYAGYTENVVISTETKTRCLGKIKVMYVARHQRKS
ncbi:hypothetical protein COY25_01095 [Candidatus Uhrbacteria bacterium CG_4_10_14_0_2_um_filter_41_7]|uniref:Uncharacterized protein n=1 Tax=Candidatus Uhrbacteria bacterium CG_4_9_14_3_um_filter_41_35 TaxID=1975034 RepID=A0A2M7XFN1_9BACT|nr:MAG: hypothetical protein COV92_00750 [Candidatus Uhrbacteria bacterium CG11_big_fil_rev_8_21_14_0_20_41_9]PIZ55277.1 MAG: hypothetical protein COY25_01095 [Candidatus Uhrbacteria bacterium CG_4_10_14_0_2_um_filter_41_7]PJA46687.1 MAG: hypothetical protein CO173_02880 [Candidatus Uhrbacteria bacterium CG_4_9_14_3_um_filter_41_35]